MTHSHVGGGADERHDRRTTGGRAGRRGRRPGRVAAAVVSAAAEALEDRRLLAANLLDSTFGGGDGVLTTNVVLGNEGATGVAVLSSGKVVAAGTARGGPTGADVAYAVVRYNADGSPDLSFGGGDGRTTLAVGPGDAAANALAVRSDGKLLVAGSATAGTGSARGLDFAVVRFNADGSVDRGFGGGGTGRATTPIGTGTADVGRAVLVLPDGDVVVAGSSETTNAEGERSRTFAVVRYDPDGTPDKAFGGGDGIVTTDVGDTGDEAASAVARGPGGTFYVAGAGDGRLLLARYRADGSPDPSFDGDGVAVRDDWYFGPGDHTTGIAVLADGRVLVSATDGGTVLVARFNPDGTRDAAFGDDGVAAVGEVYGGPAAPMAVLPGGKILVAAGPFVAARLNPDGSSDATFDGDDGRFQPDLYPALGSNGGTVAAVAVRPDGRAVLAGQFTLYGPGIGADDPQFGLVRLKNLQLAAPSDPDDQVGEAVAATVGGSRSGAVDRGTDVDVFKFAAAAGQRVAFDLDRASGSGLDSVVRVFDATGRELGSSDDAPAPGEPAGTTESYLRVQFPAAGTYYVGVSGTANGSYNPLTGGRDVAGSTGGYVLRLADAPVPADPDDQIAEAPALGVNGGPRSGAIDPETDVDLVRFTAAAGQRVGIDVDVPGGSRLDPHLRLFAADGSELAATDNEPAPGEAGSVEPYVEFTFAAAGTYYAGVSANTNGGYDPRTGTGDAAGGTGAYSLSLVNRPGTDPDDQIAEAVALPAGATRSRTISPAADVDMFAIVVPAGRIARVDLDLPAGSGLNAAMQLFDAAGQQLDFSDNGRAPGEPASNEPYLDFAPAAGGTYYVGVSSNGNTGYDPVTGNGDSAGSKGDYVLTYSLATPVPDPDDQIAEARPLPTGTAVAGTLVDRDVDLFRFDVAAPGQAVTVTLRELAGADVVLRVFRPDGTSDGYADSSFTTTFGGGTYYMGVSGAGNEAYDPVTGTGDRAGSTGGYELTLTRSPPIDGPVDPDDQIAEARPVGTAPVEDSVAFSGDVDMYKFAAAAGEEIAFDVTQASLDAIVRLFDSTGQELDGADDPAHVQHRFEAAGTYYLGVSGYSNSSYSAVTGGGDDSSRVGPYRLTMTRIPADPDDQVAEARALALGAVASGAIAVATDVDMFAFPVVAGRAVAIDLDRATTGGLVDGILRVFDAAGREVASDQGRPGPGEVANREAFLAFVPAATGTFYVGVSASENWGYNPLTGDGDYTAGTPGTYTLVVSTPPDDPDDEVGEAVAVALGTTRTGALATPADVDMYKVTVAAGQRVAIDLDRTAGSGLDAVLRLFDAAGNEWLRSDDTPAPGEGLTSDPYLEFVARNAQTFYVGVSSSDNIDYGPTTGLGDARGASSGGYALRFVRLT